MTLRRHSPRAKSRWALLTAVVAGLMLALVAGTLALPTDQIELDKNATNDGNSDWNDVYDAILSGDDTCSSLGAVECAFVHDGIGDTIFTGGGSKDPELVADWRHTTGSVPDKDEILNAYAAKYLDGTDQIIYFGADRYAVNGSADFGFWFFKGDVGPIANGTFSGEHQVGDILILGTFTNGGAVATARVYQWVGSGGNEGSLQGPLAGFGDCVPGAAGADGCITVNNETISVDWDYQSKSNKVPAGDILAGGFVEGGINLTALGLEGCFSSFLAETRSSPSLTATLKDFTGGSFEACDSGLTTTPSDNNGDAIGPGGISIGTGGSVLVKDSADLDIAGVSVWSGTLDFYLCGPDAGLCDDSGTLISSHTVTQADPSPFLSDAAEVTAAGDYCWAAFFEADTPGVPDAEDATEGECFTVNPVTPTIVTNATTTAVLGNAIDDTATLSGTANQPGSPVINPTTAGGAAGGTITFNLYGPSETASCVEANLIGTSVVDVTSGDGDYKASDGTVTGTLTPTAVGTYWWIASYSGDSPNTLGATGACGDANESTTITGTASLATAQDWLPNDTATLTGDTNLDGTLTFQLYTGDNCGATSGAAVAGQEYVVPVVDAASGSTFSTSNTTFKVKAADSGDYSWLVTYVDDVLDSPDPHCETTSITIVD